MDQAITERNNTVLIQPHEETIAEKGHIPEETIA